MVSRRKLLMGGGFLAVLASGGLLYRGALEARILSTIETVFGSGAARSEVADLFTKDLIASMEPEHRRMLGIDSAKWRLTKNKNMRFEHGIAQLFAQSTNVVRATETGGALEYIALFLPYENSCANALSANWL